MRNRVNPEMIELARVSRGLSQLQLSNELEVSQATLSRILNGFQDITSELFDAVIETLGYPKDFYYQKSPSAPTHPFFYRKRNQPTKAFKQFEAYVKVYRMALDRLMEPVDELPYSDILEHDFSNETPEDAAKISRFKLKLGSRSPIQNLVNVIENTGVIVAKVNFLPNKIDGLTTVSDSGRRMILLNNNMSNDRQRFSLAHEFGHVLLHHYYIPKKDEDIEEQANRFASEFLMPEEGIKQMLSGINFSKIADLKRHWKVSMKSIIYRAKKLNVITPKQYQSLLIQYSQRGFNANEPILLEDENPTIISTVVKLFIEDLGYSKSEIASILKVSVSDIEDWFIPKRVGKFIVYNSK